MIRFVLQGIISITGGAKMKTFVIEEKFVGYADITIEAETEEEAKRKYELGHYDICEVNTCDDTYDHTFMSIVEEK